MLVRRAPRTEPLINESLSTKNLGIWAPKWAPKSVILEGKWMKLSMNMINHGILGWYYVIYIWYYMMLYCHSDTHLGHFTSRWHRASCCTAFDWMDLECASSSVQASTDSTCWHRLLVQDSPRTMSEIWFQGKLAGNPYSWWGNYMKLWFLDL